MQSLLMVALIAVMLKSVNGLSFYPGIFDPNPFIPKMHPEVLRITSSALHEPIYVQDSSGGAQDGESGYVKSNSERGTGGYHHVETFQKKGANDYDYEYQKGHGESKNDENFEDRRAPSLRKRGSDGTRDVSNYEVIEEHGNDHGNPVQQMTYGVKPTKQIKKQMVPEFGTRLTLPKKTTIISNNNGYETVVYHGQENESSEKGYDWRKLDKAIPKPVSANQEEDENTEDEDQEKLEADNQDEDNEKNDEQSNYDDNYDGFKYDKDFDDFSKNFEEGYESNHNEDIDDEKDERSHSGRDNYDYDEEVDREEVDASANQDRYQGGEYDDDDDYRKANRRHFEHSSYYDE